MARPTKNHPKLPDSTKRLSEFLDERGIQRKQFAVEIGMSPSGLNSIFQRGVAITTVQAKAIEYKYGVNETWLLNGEEPKMIDQQDKLNLGERWLLKSTSPDSVPTEITMVIVPLTLVGEYFRFEAQQLMLKLWARGLDLNEKLFKQIQDWHNDIHSKLKGEWAQLKDDIPVKLTEDRGFFGSFAQGPTPDQLRQWQTIRYYFMDLTIPEEQPLPSSEAKSLGIDIDLSWIRVRREKFLKPWKELLLSVERKLAEVQEDNPLDEI